MTQFLLAAVTGAAIALSSLSAAPVRAEGLTAGDLAKILGGIAIIGIIGKHIADNRRDDPPKERSSPPRRKDTDWRKHRQTLVDQRRLPRSCLHRLERRGRDRVVFGDRCLRREFGLYRHLPRHCASQVYAYGRPRDVFGARCLRRAGWVAGGRH